MDLMKTLGESVAATQAAPALVPSQYQQAIYDASPTKANLVVEAVAGSGKTTTIVEVMRRAQTDSLFLAFNKSIQEELQTRLPYGTTCKTFNALGHNLMLRRATSRRLETQTKAILLKELLKPDVYREIGYDARSLLSLALQNAFGIREANSIDNWTQFILNSPLPCDNVELMANVLFRALNSYIQRSPELMDFDSQLYIPVFFDMKFPKFSLTLVDEAQDLSPIQHVMLERLAREGTQMIAVGDTHQAIYAFRGADSMSMSKLREMFAARSLPLSVCYRCDTDIVLQAKTIVPHIEAREGAPAGQITYHDRHLEPSEYPKDSMILCRNNAPLFGLALQFLKAKVPCYLVNQWGDALVALIDRQGASNTKELRVRINAWADEECQKAMDASRDHLISGIEDKREAILYFCDDFESVTAVKAALMQLMQATVGPRLSSIHKAKGLEADEVFIYRSDLLPSRYAMKQHERGNPAPMQQENNLRYVAITRARHHLHYTYNGE